jgi:hypothetical protein
MAQKLDLRPYGCYSLDDLQPLAVEPVKWLVENLVAEGSTNFFVGASGLGKTPFCLQLALAVSTGTPFLGFKTTPTSVLYCDSESGIETFYRQARAISGFLGLPAQIPRFHVWSPTWTPDTNGRDAADRLLELVRVLKPGLVIMDPFRLFFSSAELKSDEAAKAILRLKAYRSQGVAWFIVHHIRKPKTDGTRISLPDDPRGWTNEAAGSAALMNHIDCRLGIEDLPQKDPADVVIGGFIRHLGTIPPMKLVRAYDALGDPLGYRPKDVWEDFAPTFREALRGFVPGEIFRYTDMVAKCSGMIGSALQMSQSW